MDFDALRQLAAGRVASLAAYLFPGGTLRGREYVALNHVRGDRHAGSFSINVQTGAWRDFADDDARGGDVVSLWAYASGCSQADAARALAKWLGGAALEPAPAPMPAPKPRPAARQDDAADLWASARPVWPDADADVARWLESRGLCAEAVDALQLARWVPRWPWGSGTEAAARRLVVRVYDADGDVVALRGRLVVPMDAPDVPKEKGPPRVPIGGRLLACPLGAAMLRGDASAGERVLICEGTPDWLSLATLWGPDASSQRLAEAPAVLGIWSGSLSDAVLARIPDRAEVTLCPHRDQSGAGYMRTAARALLPRGCRVASAPFDGDRDFNDTLLAGGRSLLWQRLDASEALA